MTEVKFTRPYVVDVVYIFHHSSLIVSWTTKQHPEGVYGSLESLIGSSPPVELGTKESVTGVDVEGSVLELVALAKERVATVVSIIYRAIESCGETWRVWRTYWSDGRLRPLRHDEGSNSHQKDEKPSWKHHGAIESWKTE